MSDTDPVVDCVARPSFQQCRGQTALPEVGGRKSDDDNQHVSGGHGRVLVSGPPGERHRLGQRSTHRRRFVMSTFSPCFVTF